MRRRRGGVEIQEPLTEVQEPIKSHNPSQWFKNQTIRR
jgi:hypothetical protein